MARAAWADVEPGPEPRPSPRLRRTYFRISFSLRLRRLPPSTTTTSTFHYVSDYVYEHHDAGPGRHNSQVPTLFLYNYCSFNLRSFRVKWQTRDKLTCVISAIMYKTFKVSLLKQGCHVRHLRNKSRSWLSIIMIDAQPNRNTSISKTIAGKHRCRFMLSSTAYTVIWWVGILGSGRGGRGGGGGGGGGVVGGAIVCQSCSFEQCDIYYGAI